MVSRKVALRAPVIAQRTKLLGYRLDSGHHHPAFPGSNGFARVEAEAADIRQRTGVMTVVPGAYGARGVLNHVQTVLSGNLEYRMHGRADAEQRDRDDHLCT